jgi:YegS/Rv2252/BmrU family lipid kinase
MFLAHASAKPLMIQHALLIVNPASRRGSRLEDKAVQAFATAGVRCTVMHTKASGHGAQLAAAHASEHDAIFTLGGDGTAIEVIGALAHSGPPVGILPGGTANVVARTLGTPVRIGRAVAALIDGDEARIDLGVLSTGHRFMIGMGVGLDATMIANAPGALKRRLGFFAYVIGALRAFMKLEKFTVKLTIDGVLYEMRASAVLVANFGAVMNDLLAFGDGIQRDDGVLNACVYSPRNVVDATRILWKMTFKKFTPDRSIFYKSGSSFQIETDTPRLGQADGELIGNSPFTVTVEPLAARVLVPKR